MTQRRMNIRLGVVFVTVFALRLLPGSLWASEPEGGDATKNFWGTSPLVIPAAAFATNGLAPTSQVFNTNGFVGGGTSYHCMQAPAYFPDHATVTRLYASISDMSASDMSVSLVRATNNSYSSTTEMARVTSNGNTSPTALANWYGDSTITGADVSYPEYSYYVVACLPDYNFRLYQVEIDFTDRLIFSDGFDTGETSPWSSIVGVVAPASPATKAESIEVRLDPVAAAISPIDKSVAFDSPLTIAAAEFKPDGWQVGEVFVGFNDGVMYGANYSQSRFMHAPVWLPDGATITSVKARVIDDDAGGGGASNCESGAESEIEMWLYRSKGCSADTCSDEMLNSSTSGASAALQFLPSADPTISFPVVDGQQYGYYLMMRLCGPKHKVYGVRVEYSYP